MSTFSWMETENALSPAALTVRAQTISPNDNGRLRWDLFLPRRDVDSVDLRDMTSLDDRPAADRREWNARGRYIPVLTPAQREMSIIPIEAYDKIEELEMQRLRERTSGNDAQLRQLVGVTIPARIDRLALADYRRLDIDAMTSWALGTITQRSPQNAALTVTASFGFSATRLTTAAVAWSDPARNAWNDFIAWYTGAIDLAGPGEGVVLRLATLNAILADAPDQSFGVKMTRPRLDTQVQDVMGSAFNFVVIEDSVDVFDDGGTAVTRTKLWPAQRVAFIPAGGRVGYTAFAPVSRAMQLSAQVPNAGIDVRGTTVYSMESNDGRELTIECQLNAMPVPDEQKVVVINAGV